MDITSGQEPIHGPSSCPTPPVLRDPSPSQKSNEEGPRSPAIDHGSGSSGTIPGEDEETSKADIEDMRREIDGVPGHDDE